MKLEGERTRTNLKVLETLTYSCSNPQDLHILGSQVEELITSFRTKLPKSEGIILRPEARKSVRKRAQQRLKKYRPLPLSVRRGRQKSDWHHRNHVGQKAWELRKVYTLTPIYKLKTYNHLFYRLHRSCYIKLHKNPILKLQTFVTENWMNSKVAWIQVRKHYNVWTYIMYVLCTSYSLYLTVDKKRKRCEHCSGCTKDDCGSCICCLDMRKFGGSGRRKQCCVKRQCLRPVVPTKQVCISLLWIVYYELNKCVYH